MMQKRMPRLIALLLCLLMVIGMMPVSLAADPAPAATEYEPVDVKIPFNAVGTYTLTETENNTGKALTTKSYTFPVNSGENAIVLTFSEPEKHVYTLKRTDTAADARNNQEYTVEILVKHVNKTVQGEGDTEATVQYVLEPEAVIYPTPKAGQNPVKVPEILNVAIKIKKIGERDKLLSGAKFKLYGEDAVETVDGKTKLKQGATPLVNQEFVTSSAEATLGTVELGDLQPGVYYLEETKAPERYRLPEDLFKITVTYEEKDEKTVAKVTVEPGEAAGVSVTPAAEDDENREFTISIKNEFEALDVELNKFGEVIVPSAENPGTFTVDDSGIFDGATFEIYAEENFDTDTWKPKTDADGNPLAPAYTAVAGESVDPDTGEKRPGIVYFEGVRIGKYYMIESDTGDHGDGYWDNDAVYRVVVSEPAAGESKPSLTVTVAKASTGTASEAGTGTLTDPVENGDYSILNRLIAYRIRLVKQDQDTVQPLQGAEFKLYAAGTDGVALTDDGKIPDGANALKTVTTGTDGKADLGRLVIGEYWLAETKAPEGYLLLEKPIAITVTASGATALIDGQATTDVVISQTKDENNAVVPHDLTLDVLNPAKVEVTLDVEKMVETKSEEEFTFQFESRLTDVAPLSGSTVTKAKLEALNSALLASKDPTKDPIQTISVKVRGSKTTGKGSATGSFTAVRVYGAGTYTFTIKELVPNPKPAGWTYDDITKTATVTVAEDATTHKLAVTGIVYSNPVTADGEEFVAGTTEGKAYEGFTNEYEKKGTWTPEVSKELTGRPIVAGEFTFTMKEGDKEVATGSVNADGSITWTPAAIDYTLEDVGSHTYVVTEVAGSAEGITYSTESVTVAVTVADDAAKSSLTVTPTYPADKVFNNIFSASGEWTPKVFKTLNGRDMKEGETYTVTVRDITNIQGLPEATSGILVMNGTVTMGKDGVPKDFIFNPEKIKYDQDDLIDNKPTTFTYQIAETRGNSGGVTYSEEVYTVHVTVALHENNDGTISDKLDVTDDLPENSSFINTYTTIPVAAAPQAEKTIVGEETVDDMKFRFTLKATDVVAGGSFLTRTYNPAGTNNTPIANNQSWTKEITVLKGTRTSVPIPFESFTYTKTGVYTYTLKEENITPTSETDPIARITPDTAEWTVKVNVTDDKNGNLVASTVYLKDGVETEAASAAFENTYTPTPAKQKLQAEKVLKGDKLHDAKNTTFTFTLSYLSGPKPVTLETKDEEGNTTTKEISSDPTDNKNVIGQVEIPGDEVEKTGSALAQFDELILTGAGTYLFKIVEEKGNTPKVDYDSTVWNAIVTVEDIHGVLTVTGVRYKNMKTKQFSEKAMATFTNTYTPDETDYQPVAYKEVTGDPRPSGEGVTDVKELFQFKLSLVSADPDETGATIPEGGDEASCKEGEEAQFGQITFKLKGKYVYRIEEVEPENHPDYYKYDGRPWTLTIVITDNADGELVVQSHDYAREGDSSADGTVHAVFSNEYHPTPVELKIPAEKKMEAGSDPLEADASFTFTLTAKGETHDTAAGTNGGDAAGGDASGSDASGGTQNDAGGGDASGGTQNDATGGDASGGDATGGNQNDATGRSYLSEDEGKTPIPADGSWSRQIDLTVPKGSTTSPVVEFGAITYTSAGTYTYTVTEETGTVPGMTYSKETRTVIVTVTDKGGVLEATWTVDGEAEKPAVHTNRYVVPKVEVDVTKAWDDKENQDDIRPKKITVTLKAEYTKKDGSKETYTVGEPTVNPVELKPATPPTSTEPDKATSWPTHTWTGLPKYRELTQEVSYFVEEAEILYWDASVGDYRSAPEGFERGYEVSYSIEKLDAAAGNTTSGDGTATGGDSSGDGTATGGDSSGDGTATGGDSSGDGTATGGDTSGSGDSTGTAENVGKFVITVTNRHVPETMTFELKKLGEIQASSSSGSTGASTGGTGSGDTTGGTGGGTQAGGGTQPAGDATQVGGTIEVTVGNLTYTINTEAFNGATFALYKGKDFDPVKKEPKEYDEQGNSVTPMIEVSENGVVTFERVRYGTYFLIETNMGSGHSSYWDNNAVYRLVLRAPAAPGEEPTVTMEVFKPADGTENGASTGVLIGDVNDYTIVNMLIGYRIQLLKQDAQTETPLNGATFNLYAGDTVLDADGKIPANTKPLNAEPFVTAKVGNVNGVIDLKRLTIGEYYLAETAVPETGKNHCVYRLMEDPIRLKVEKTGVTVTIKGKSSDTAVITQDTEQHTATLTVTNQAYGDLRIVKSITATGPDTASFVFRITWTDLKNVVQTRYATITINSGEDEGEYVLAKAIPTGTEVTVEEVNDGIQFSYNSGNGKQPIALTSAEKAVEFDFSNDHSGPGGGHAVVNRGKVEGDGTNGYTWVGSNDSKFTDSNGTTVHP